MFLLYRFSPAHLVLRRCAAVVPRASGYHQSISCRHRLLSCSPSSVTVLPPPRFSPRPPASPFPRHLPRETSVQVDSPHPYCFRSGGRLWDSPHGEKGDGGTDVKLMEECIPTPYR